MSYRTRILSIGLALASCLMLPTITVAEILHDELARDVDRAESIRAVKQLQRTYAQYSQYALWNEMADLFAGNGTYIFGEESAKGRKAIAEFLVTHEGGGHQGLQPGELHTQLIEQPLVNLSVDGESARGRWYGLFLLNDSKGNASLQGGVFENEYVRENGRWKIGVLHFYPQYAGAYETGWSNWKGQSLPIVPFHFTSAESGIPIPQPVGAAPKSKASLAELEERIAVMNDESLVRNLQSAYGYYVDRRMWDDVSDLFAANGVYEVGGVGVSSGSQGIRQVLERMGPAGLTHGVLNDRLQFDTTVTFAAGRREAHVRGIELGMLGEADKGEGFWELSVFDNRFVKEDGLWKVREMRVFPVFRAEYGKGWGKSQIARDIPAFAAKHPVTGKAIAAPAGQKFVATRPLTAAIAAPGTKRSTADVATRLQEAARKLLVAKAYDGAENVSTAYGNYADDSQWVMLAEIFGKTGTKQIPYAGYYTGGERIAHALQLQYGEPVNPATAMRAGIAYHWRIQPVINVAPDGRSARLRTYLFHPNTGKNPGGTLFGAMYPDDHLILEDGIWRLWNLSLDEPYFEMPNWKGGWAAARDKAPAAAAARATAPAGTAPAAAPPRAAAPAGPATAAANPAAPARPQRYVGAALVPVYRPDVPISELGVRQEHYRGGTGEPGTGPGSCRCGGATGTRSAAARRNCFCRTACLATTHRR